MIDNQKVKDNLPDEVRDLNKSYIEYGSDYGEIKTIHAYKERELYFLKAYFKPRTPLINQIKSLLGQSKYQELSINRQQLEKLDLDLKEILGAKEVLELLEVKLGTKYRRSYYFKKAISQNISILTSKEGEEVENR